MPLIPPPGLFPPTFDPTFAPAKPPARRYVKRGAYMICLDCAMAVAYCACHRQPAPEQNAAEADAGESLARRVADCAGGR